MSVSQDWQRGAPKITEGSGGFQWIPSEENEKMLGKAWKITKNLAGVVQNFIKILWFDSRRVGISPLNQGNMGG